MGYLYLALSTLVVTVWALFYVVVVRRNCEVWAVNLFICIAATAVVTAKFFLGPARMNPGSAALGAASGVGNYVAIMTFFYHMRKGVLSISWTILAMSIAFPVAASILFWHEHPTTRQYVGLSLIPISMLLCNYAWKKAPER